MATYELYNGNVACAEGAIAAGVRFFAGYPITPSNEVLERFALRLPEVGGIFLQMEDELGALAAVIGASIGGFKSMTATSGPGMSLMQENIGCAYICEVPCVILNVQRGGPGLGTIDPAQMDVMQARWGSHGDVNAVVFSPSTVQECFNLTIVAVNWAERLRTPVIILSDAALANMEEIVRIPDLSEVEIINRKKPRVEPNGYKCYMPDLDDLVPPMAEFGGPYRSHISSLSHLDNGFASMAPEVIEGLLKRLSLKVEKHKKQLSLFEELYTEDADICVIAYGITARSAKAAVKVARERGLKAGLFRLISIWPFPYEKVEEVVKNSKVIVVPELNMGQISGEIEKVNKSAKKTVQLNQINGRLPKPNEILQKIEEAFTNYAKN